MDLLLIVSDLDPAGQPRGKRTVTCPQGRAVVGAGGNVPLPGPAAGGFALDTNPAGELTLTRCDPGLDLRRDGQPLAAGALVRNGDRLRVPGGELQLVLAFAHAAPGRAARLMPALMLALVVLIMLTEVAIATWLPRQISRRHFWGEELARQQLLARVDVLRSGLFLLARKSKSQNPYLPPTVALVRAEVDQLALHLRQQQGRLTPGQIRACGEDLARYERVLDWLKRNALFPPDTPLALEPALQQLLKEKTTP